MNETTSTNPGKPLSIAALIISILALLGTPIVLFISLGIADVEEGRGGGMGLAIAWMFFCSFSVLLGILGRKKSLANGYKATMPVVAIVIGLIAELICVGIVYSIFQL
ncbi:MAG: hypothetical protein ABIQ40_18390 [Bacteroidia bacterium]